ncbi:MAG: CdaR family protein [Lentisphaerota bacterium]
MDFRLNNQERDRFRWIPAVFRNDFLRKFIAVFFAVLVYLMVANKIGTEEKISNVPVDIELPGSLINLDARKPTISVTVRGSKKNISGIGAMDIKVKAEVVENKYITGFPYLLKLSIDNIKTPFGVTAINFDPKEIPLSLERNDSKKVMVEQKFDSIQFLPKDYTVGKIKINPAEVLIIGPQSIIGEIKSVQTRPIPLDNQTIESFEYQAPLSVPDSIKVSPVKVTVQVEIVRNYITRIFKSVPIRMLQSPDDRELLKVELLSTPNADITVYGPQSKVSLLKPEEVKSYIDVSSLQESGSFSSEVCCWLNDPEIKVKNIYPEKVKLKLTRIKK